MSKKIIAIYEDDLGLPVTGLTPTVKIWLLESTPTLIISGVVMTEIADGAYYYNFLAYTGIYSYLFRCDGGTSMDGLNRYSWSSNELDPATIASGVWDENRYTYTDSGTFGHGYSTTEGWTIGVR